MNAPAVLELPLDDALLKVLSSESRREILRLLRERRMTGAELATRLELGKPAVAEHLKKLQEAELIERSDDPERRWVYYNLSARGRGILEPQRVRFYLVMAVAAMALMVGVALALGVVVLLQAQSATDLAAGGIDDGALLEGSQGQAGLDPGNPMAASRDTVPDTRANVTAPASGLNVIMGPPRDADPVGGSNLPASTTSGYTLVLDEPVQRRSATSPNPGILVYRARDIDSLNNTVRLHLVHLDEAQLAQANLTEAVQNATSVPGIGILVQIPDDTLLPGMDGAATAGTNGTESLETTNVEADVDGDDTNGSDMADGDRVDAPSSPSEAEGVAEAEKASIAGTTDNPTDNSTDEATIDPKDDSTATATTTATATATATSTATFTATSTSATTNLDPPLLAGSVAFTDAGAETGALSGAGFTASRSEGQLTQATATEQPGTEPSGAAAPALRGAYLPVPLLAIVGAALVASLYLPERRK